MALDQVQGHAAAHRVADQMHFRQTECIEKRDHLLDPAINPGGRTLRRMMVRALAKTGDVRRETMISLAKKGQRELPVRHRIGAGA